MWSRERISVCAYFAILGLVCSAWVSSFSDTRVLIMYPYCLSVLLAHVSRW